MTGSWDTKKITREVRWLRKYPAFEERPATLTEFFDPEYLNIKGKVRKRIESELTEIIGADVSGERITRFPLALITGGIGIGKTTIASIVLPYLAHWVLCLKDPQDFFALLPGSRIAFMQMSTSEDQAKEVVFGDIKARIQHSPWFTSKYPYDPNFKNQLRFSKDIWILPGDSTETSFEGYNILGGILDEADSHKVTKNKDYAEAGYDTIHARITSRFGDRGFLLVIGQKKRSNGFVAKKHVEFRRKENAYAVSMAIWDSLGPDYYEKDSDGNVKTFWYDTHRKQIVPPVAAMVSSENLIEIPILYREDFEGNPEKALRDLAGIPPLVVDPFISLVHKVYEARDRWVADADGLESPVRPDGRLEPWFRAPNSLKRVGHIDLAYSGEGDALGFAMGHVRELVEREDELKPYIVIDLLLRMKAHPGSQLLLGDIRHFIYNLRGDLKFKLVRVTLDGFESTDTIQQFNRRRIDSEVISVDKQLLPYHDLREAIYEDRIEIPKYMVKMNHNDMELTEVAIKELTELVYAGDKVDHPLDGSKDVADAIAGVTYTLMGDRMFHRKVTRIDSHRPQRQEPVAAGMENHPAFIGSTGMYAPVPPSNTRPTLGR